MITKMMIEEINQISQAIKSTKLQVAALALYLDVNETTISKWNSNAEQPSLKRLHKLGEILEVDNQTLLKSMPRPATGLPHALQLEYKRLLKSGLKKKVKALDNNGKTIEVNNPVFVKALQDFVEHYKK